MYDQRKGIPDPAITLSGNAFFVNAQRILSTNIFIT